MKNEHGCKGVLKTDNTYLYLACGITLAKFDCPDMRPVFITETEHQGEIIDFTLST